MKRITATLIAARLPCCCRWARRHWRKTWLSSTSCATKTAVNAGFYEDLLGRFSEDNPGISVAVNVVPYTTVRDQLRVQVEAGQAPDMARITDFAGMAGFYSGCPPADDGSGAALRTTSIRGRSSAPSAPVPKAT